MKTVKYLTLLLCVVAFQQVVAQKKLSDNDRIAILPYVSDQVEFLPTVAKNNLQSKLAQIVTANGYGSSVGFQNRFIITPNIAVVDKYIVAGAPTKVSLTLDIAFYVGDGITGIKYGSTALSVKGVGRNEAKAFISAVNTISPRNQKLTQLLEEAKQKIINYYNDCDLFLSDVDRLAAMDQFNAALNLVNSIPKVSKVCYNKAFKKVRPLYKKKIDRDCKVLLGKAQNAWNLGQNLASAKAAGSFLTQISPAASCYGDVTKLYNEINAKLRKDEQRAWDFIIEAQKNFNEYKNEELEVYREINVERAKNLPKNIYNVRGWW